MVTSAGAFLFILAVASQILSMWLDDLKYNNLLGLKLKLATGKIWAYKNIYLVGYIYLRYIV